jgi:hypothetical protein
MFSARFFIDFMEEHKINTITWQLEDCPLNEVKDIPPVTRRDHPETPLVFRFEVVMHKGYLFEEAQQKEKVDFDRIELEKGYSLYIPILYAHNIDLNSLEY